MRRSERATRTRASRRVRCFELVESALGAAAAAVRRGGPPLLGAVAKQPHGRERVGEEQRQEAARAVVGDGVLQRARRLRQRGAREADVAEGGRLREVSGAQEGNCASSDGARGRLWGCRGMSWEVVGGRGMSWEVAPAARSSTRGRRPCPCSRASGSRAAAGKCPRRRCEAEV